MPALFHPLTLRGVTLRNRIGVSPMCQYWAGDDGLPTDWHLVHLGSRAVGGAGLVVTEMTAVEPRGRTGPRDTGIWSDAHIAPWRRIAGFIKDNGAVPGIQVGHAGRRASIVPEWQSERAKEPLSVAEGGWDDIVAPSALPLRRHDRIPRALSEAEIRDMVEAFRSAARRADEAGFEWLELHAAHGYLHASFLSPFSNKRNDRYGGDFEGRTRFTLETVRAMRTVWPDDKPFAVRLSATEWIDGGWNLEDTIALARLLRSHGVDLIDCSSGLGASGGEFPRHPKWPGWQVPFAEAVRRQAGVATSAVGMIVSPHQADAIIREERADLVLVATEMLKDPYWAFHAAAALGPLSGSGVEMPPPYQYVVSRDVPPYRDRGIPSHTVAERNLGQALRCLERVATTRPEP